MLNGKKTYIVSILSIIAGAILLAAGVIDSGQFTVIVEGALIGMGIRHGISTK